MDIIISTGSISHSKKIVDNQVCSRLIYIHLIQYKLPPVSVRKRRAGIYKMFHVGHISVHWELLFRL